MPKQVMLSDDVIYTLDKLRGIYNEASYSFVIKKLLETYNSKLTRRFLVEKLFHELKIKLPAYRFDIEPLKAVAIHMLLNLEDVDDRVKFAKQLMDLVHVIDVEVIE